jgi:hypothetical protein
MGIDLNDDENIFSDCSEENINEVMMIIEREKELHFQKSRLISKGNLVKMNHMKEQSTNNLTTISIFSRGVSKSNIFRCIDQRQECIGIGVISSSEVG